jgi:hypothetical protein
MAAPLPLAHDALRASSQLKPNSIEDEVLDDDQSSSELIELKTPIASSNPNNAQYVTPTSHIANPKKNLPYPGHL